MENEFYAEMGFPIERYKGLAELDPTNPFYTPNYVEARRELGFQPWFLSILHENCLSSGCTAFLKSGRFSKLLEIPSLCSMPEDNTFWNGMLQFCKDKQISELNVNTYASNSVTIPSISTEIERKNRNEHVLFLRNANLWGGLSSNHKRNIKRGIKTNLQMRCTTTLQACEEHARLQQASMLRRNNRGESVPLAIQVRGSFALIESGAGELYQVLHEGKVVSSVLVLKADKGAYYHSAGTSPHGMRIGASHFLVYNIAEALQKDSIEIFNLGGADESAPGLHRFKRGFGTSEVKLESAQFVLSSKFKMHMLGSARTLYKYMRLCGIRI